MTEPFLPANCTVAFQLNWSLSVFGISMLPMQDVWLEKLKEVTEPDGVRVLECRPIQSNTCQFFISTKPIVSPSEIVRSVKGRFQNLIREQYPRAFRRNYRIESVGAANLESIDQYVSHQTDHHQMADPRIQDILNRLQFHDARIDLTQINRSSAGEYLHNLHIVLETIDGLMETRSTVLERIRETIVRSSGQNEFHLSRIGLLSNHVHLVVGCDVTDVPMEVALSYLNALAGIDEGRPIFRHSFYVGTVGNFDRNVIRNQLKWDGEL